MVQQFRIKPTIYMIDTCEEFCKELQVGERDLILTNPTYFVNYFDSYINGAQVVYFNKYGKGEPTDKMVEALYEDIKDMDYDRLIAIGGGSIIDVAKILVQETVLPLLDLFEKRIPTKKAKELVIVPTTCGTGSEVTSVSVIELTCINMKFGLQTDEEFADAAVLVPQLLDKLPNQFFATSSIDALIHAIESYMSPRATAFSEMYSEKAIELILGGYQTLVATGEKNIHEFLLASTYAGIAFGNAGCAAVHAMSMPFSGAYHVPHGEANYVIFTGVFKAYNRLNPDGKIQKLNKMLSDLLDCEISIVYEELEKLLNQVLQKKTLQEYGVREEELAGYTKVVMEKQGRLMGNNYTDLSADDVYGIYESLYCI